MADEVNMDTLFDDDGSSDPIVRHPSHSIGGGEDYNAPPVDGANPMHDNDAAPTTPEAPIDNKRYGDLLDTILKGADDANKILGHSSNKGDRTQKIELGAAVDDLSTPSKAASGVYQQPYKPPPRTISTAEKAQRAHVEATAQFRGTGYVGNYGQHGDDASDSINNSSIEDKHHDEDNIADNDKHDTDTTLQRVDFLRTKIPFKHTYSALSSNGPSEQAFNMSLAVQILIDCEAHMGYMSAAEEIRLYSHFDKPVRESFLTQCRTNYALATTTLYSHSRVNITVSGRALLTKFPSVPMFMAMTYKQLRPYMTVALFERSIKDAETIVEAFLMQQISLKPANSSLEYYNTFLRHMEDIFAWFRPLLSSIEHFLGAKLPVRPNKAKHQLGFAPTYDKVMLAKGWRDLHDLVIAWFEPPPTVGAYTIA